MKHELEGVWGCVCISVGVTESWSEGIVLHIGLDDKYLRPLETSFQPLNFTFVLQKTTKCMPLDVGHIDICTWSVTVPEWLFNYTLLPS